MTREEALSRMTALCSTAEHCESDVRERLQRAALDSTDIDAVVDFLYDNDFLNTSRYCMAFAHDKLRFAHWGRVKIEQALRLKHLPKSDIRDALDALPEEEYAAALDAAVSQKLRSTASVENVRERRDKLLRFVVGRGFTIDEALQAIASHLTADDY